MKDVPEVGAHQPDLHRPSGPAEARHDLLHERRRHVPLGPREQVDPVGPLALERGRDPFDLEPHGSDVDARVRGADGRPGQSGGCRATEGHDPASTPGGMSFAAAGTVSENGRVRGAGDGARYGRPRRPGS